MKPAVFTTPKDTEVLVQRSFQAPPELVWRAYTEPDLMRRWLTGTPGWTMPVCEMDLRVGGKYRWLWRNEEAGQEFGFHGKFTEVTPHTRLAHTQVFDQGDLTVTMGEEGSVITVVLTPHQGGTLVSTTMTYASLADRDDAMSTGMTDGMEFSYQQLDKLMKETGSK